MAEHRLDPTADTVIDAGLRVGDDVSVVGFDDIVLTDLAAPRWPPSGSRWRRWPPPEPWQAARLS